MREFLEKNHKDDLDNQQTIKLAVETLMEVVESAKNIEVFVVYPENKKEMLSPEAVEAVVKQIEKEKEEAEAAK